MLKSLLAACLVLPFHLNSAFAGTGVAIFDIPAVHHGRDMETAVFYPAQGGQQVSLGENGVFHGVPVYENAQPLDGRFPVVLMSHGWGGNFKRMAWLSAALAEKGAIVVAVNHPNSTTGELGNLNALDHWTRPKDLSAALDHALSSPLLADHIDESRIYAAGFSYGGWSALSLGGLVGSHEGFTRLCMDGGKATSHCAAILRAGIKIENIDPVKWEASYKDPRISAVAAIDPAMTFGLTASSTAGLDVPVLLIGLGDGEHRLHATDTSEAGSNFDALVPAARKALLAPATHFTALGLCKPDGEAILKDEQDDPVCSDPPGSSREAIMDRIIGLIAAHFGLG